MSERSATSDKHYPFIKFIGVAGVVAILGAAVSLGHTQQIVEDTSDLAKRDLQQVEMLARQRTAPVLVMAEWLVTFVSSARLAW